MTASSKSPTGKAVELFEFKSAALSVVVFQPKTANLAELETALLQRLGNTPDFFGNEPALLDLSQWSTITPDLPKLVRLLSRFGLQVTGVKGVNDTARASAKKAGLPVFADTQEANLPPAQPAPVEEVAPQVVTVVERRPTMVIDKPVRSGQQVYAKDSDLVIMGMVSNGAEVIADGDIHVYAPLRGRALAGARGEDSARIYTTCMEAELVSIAGIYRSLDEVLPASIRGRPAQVRLASDKLSIEALVGS
ncbi:septum site-determining protein MinC [Parachitinimonas caeni]|uniref:Probable septum site-determining protein MinC n=1 Tax=Parachitinimonas caeni TaxID=3031301 RepID=A0ABT7DXA6_9NEIS|nr:septum site-determining protein MinC [Parachitinimonas caeni]MDK2123713.1 septum site-determining protein MinC [Parachitinimonas caeni]